MTVFNWNRLETAGGE